MRSAANPTRYAPAFNSCAHGSRLADGVVQVWANTGTSSTTGFFLQSSDATHAKFTQAPARYVGRTTAGGDSLDEHGKPGRENDHDETIDRRMSRHSGWCSAAAAPRSSPQDSRASALASRLSAFGLTVLTMAFAIGHISGCHLGGGHGRPRRRRPASQAIPYIVVQVIQAVIGAGCVYLIADGVTGFDVGQERPRHQRLRRSLARSLQPDVGLRLRSRDDLHVPMIILGATDKRAPAEFRAHRHRPWSHPDPPDQHSGHQHFGEPRPAPLCSSVLPPCSSGCSGSHR